MKVNIYRLQRYSLSMHLQLRILIGFSVLTGSYDSMEELLIHNILIRQKGYSGKQVVF